MKHLIIPSRHYEFNFYICIALDVAEVLLVDHDVPNGQASPSQFLGGQAVLESKFLLAHCNHFPLGISNAARYLKEQKFNYQSLRTSVNKNLKLVNGNANGEALMPTLPSNRHLPRSLIKFIPFKNLFKIKITLTER